MGAGIECGAATAAAALVFRHECREASQRRWPAVVVEESRGVLAAVLADATVAEVVVVVEEARPVLAALYVNHEKTSAFVFNNFYYRL